MLLCQDFQSPKQGDAGIHASFYNRHSAFHIAKKGGFSIANRQIGDKSPLKNALLTFLTVQAAMNPTRGFQL